MKYTLFYLETFRLIVVYYSLVLCSVLMMSDFMRKEAGAMWLPAFCDRKAEGVWKTYLFCFY